MASNADPHGDIVKRGVWLYDGSVPVAIRIVRGDTYFGSGDYEDPPEIQDDREVETFVVWYESAGEPGRFCNGSAQFFSLCDAVEWVEQTFRGTLKWL